MAIAVWTNSNVSPNNSVSLTSLSVSGFTANDWIESTSITKTPFTANSVTASSPYNVYGISPVQNTTMNVTKYNDSDWREAQTITKTPFIISVPYAWGTTTAGGGYSGQDIVVTEYADEYWFTN